MITLLDVLHCPGSAIVATRYNLQARAFVSCHFGVEISAIKAFHIHLDVGLVETHNMLVLESTSENKVAFTTEVAINIEFSLDVVKTVLWFSVDLLTNLIEVCP